MRLEQLEQVVEINRCRSVSQAAKRLFITQPSLSRSISNFEKELNVKIFRRSVQGVEPTEQGRLIIEQAEHVLNEIGLLYQNVGANNNLKGNVHLIVAPGFYNTLATELTLSFREKYPNARLIIEEKGVREIIESIDKNKYDLALTGCLMGRQTEIQRLFTSKHLKYVKFMEHSFSLFVNSRSTLLDKEYITLNEVSQLNLVEFIGTEWNLVFETLGYPLVKKPLAVSDREMLKRIVFKGKGAAILPDFYGINDTYMEQDLLCQVPIAGASEILRSIVYFVHIDTAPLSLLEEEVIRLTRQFFEKEQLRSCFDGFTLF